MTSNSLNGQNGSGQNDRPAGDEAVDTAPVADTTDPGRIDEKGSSRLGLLFATAAFAVFVVVGLGIWWSLQPEKFDVEQNAAELAGVEASELVPGTATVGAAIRVASSLLDKPGGYLHNDVLPPGVLMDNMPSWEYGALTELRDSVRSMRNDFSRSQTQSLENENLKQADSQFNFNADAWFLPSAEEEYGRGIRALEDYLTALQSGTDASARFYTRADNLNAYLQVVEKRLGSYGQRLTASVGDAELTAALTNASGGQALVDRTPWYEIDNVFFEARGYSWALLHMMQALAIDFQDVLATKNAEVSMQQIIRDLEQATIRKWSPMVLNGHGFGVLANHSLVLASYIARTNAAVLDLRNLLQRG
ncbi:MAG: DUF2333 family protein [Thiohalocapsa sp.]|nr:DUF2333 family protein [Thiohalocapsa sp.]MCF7991182.1 DUF2333 family protein [Thiohalocapsa sp.]